VLKTRAIYQFGAVQVDPLNRAVQRNGVAIALNRRAFDVLVYLVTHPGRLVTKDELLKNVWSDAVVDENNLNQSISVLRKALDEHPCEHSCITTLAGRGYQFILPVETVGLAGAEDAGQPVSVLVQQRTVTTRVVTEEEPLRLLSPAKRRAGVTVTLGVIALAGVAGYLAWRRFHPRPNSAKVVVASFLNTTGDPTFDRTLDRALEIDLSQSPYMDVMSEREVVSVLQYMGRPTDSLLTADLARQICERSNREAVLSGSIAGVGSSYLLTLEATGCATGKELAAAKAQASTKEGVLAAVDSLADRVRSKLGESAQSRETYQVPTAQATTPSLEALKAYSMGDYLVSQGRDESESLPFFQRAVELDPKFALAYGQIATDYYNQAEFDKASLYYTKAFQLSGPISAKEKLLTEAHYYSEGLNDIEGGIRTYKVWAETYPMDWAPVVNLCNQYTQIGQYAAAIEAGQKALKLQPNRGITYSVLARALTRANRFEEAKAVGALAVQRGKDSTGLHATLYDIAFLQKDQTALARETAWAAAHSDGWYKWFFPYSVASADAATGKLQQAEELFNRAEQIAREEKSTESADSVLIDLAQMEVDFGLPGPARMALQRVSDQGTDQPDLAVLYAKIGDTAPAERYIAKYAKLTSDTEIAGKALPRVRAALALERGKPYEAIAALEAARPYEFYGYLTLAQRAEAYLKAKDGMHAAAEYKKILANPGIDPGTVAYPLAHLGLARAYALSGDAIASRNEYAALFGAFKDADPGLPVLRDARAEMAALPSR
jgi:DNA-binding winged helix-turn-helix (wHTH) protein/predicted Zn-dependent protease